MFKKYQHIHFVGIGGIGMSGIAQVLLTLGYRVTGSDLKRGAIIGQLTRRGAKVFIGHKAGNVAGAQVAVISSAVRPDNPEVVEAKKQGVPIVSRAEMLAELMRLKYGIAIAGTHGKTTTTSLIATIMTSAGLDPTMVIGGRVNSFRTNARLGKGEFLVAEADESDRSFLKLSPTIAVITNIDPEHMENYRNFQHVRETYASFANKVPFYGAVIACNDHPEVRALIKHIDRRTVTYGLAGADFMATDIRQKEGVLSFNVVFKGKTLGAVSLAIPGRHNVLNALAAVAVATELEIPFAKIQKGLAKFTGIERRFQILSKKNSHPMVITDYAHHPREIEAVISAVREGWGDKRIVCVMQPHRFTRLAALFDEFVDVLSCSDVVVVLPVYSAGEAPIEGVTSRKLYQGVLAKKQDGRSVVYVDDKKAILNSVAEICGPNDIVLFLGAGDVWKIGKEFTKKNKVCLAVFEQPFDSLVLAHGRHLNNI